jgi:virginiamycin B lyase
MRRALIVLAATLLVPASAMAAPALDGEFSVSGEPDQLATGPDGNVWFTLKNSSNTKEFGKITPDGTVTEYDTPGDVAVVGIATGQDGNIWMTGNTKIIRVQPADPTVGAVTFNVAELTSPQTIVAGPGNKLWTASGSKLITITTAGLNEAPPGVTLTGARGIAVGGDGNVWVADFGAGAIVRIPPDASSSTAFNVGGGPQQVTAGPAGQLAFTNPSNALGRIAYDGSFTPTDMPNTDPFGVVFANDDAYWTAQFAVDMLARVTPSGAYTQLPLTPGSGPRYLAKGANNTLWVGLEKTKKIARVTGVEPTPEPEPVTPQPNVAPVLDQLRAVPRRVRKGKRTRFMFVSTEAGTARLLVQRIRPGRVRGGRCVAPTKRLARRKRCKRYLPVRTLTAPAAMGMNAVPFGTRRRGIGRYRVIAVVTDDGALTSAPMRAPFRVLPPRKKR